MAARTGGGTSQHLRLPSRTCKWARESRAKQKQRQKPSARPAAVLSLIRRRCWTRSCPPCTSAAAAGVPCVPLFRGARRCSAEATVAASDRRAASTCCHRHIAIQVHACTSGPTASPRTPLRLPPATTALSPARLSASALHRIAVRACAVPRHSHLHHALQHRPPPVGRGDRPSLQSVSRAPTPAWASSRRRRGRVAPRAV